jgi:NAD-dependent dihydropyrimidine dehydrogenase PreA subunit
LPREVYPAKAKNMVRIVIDYAKCTGDGYKICVEICPASIFRNEKSAKPEVVNEERCNICRACQVNCPSQAIEILT